MQIYKIRLNLELNPGPDKVYTVTSPDVPGLVTEGSTPAEIIANAQEAFEGLIEAWRELGRELPPALREQVKPLTETDLLVAA